MESQCVKITFKNRTRSENSCRMQFLSEFLELLTETAAQMANQWVVGDWATIETSAK